MVMVQKNTMTAAEDPFGVFGDSDTEDEENEAGAAAAAVAASAETEAHRIARSLVQVAAVRTDFDNNYDKNNNSSDDYRPAVSATPAASMNFDSAALVVLPWSPPLYMSPSVKVCLLSEYGGGRGCVADRDLPPGTLLLVEEPIFSWSVKDNTLNLSIIHTLLEQPNAVTIVHALEHFHPTKQAVDAIQDAGDDEDDKDMVQSDSEQVKGMMETFRFQYNENEELQNLLQFASDKKILNSDESTLTETDILRLLLALRYNGLESGIFLYSAMLNHADQPNSVKFLPSSSSGEQTSYSEVRTTRAVSAGEPLTISYLPRIMSHASRRKHLWEQHRFDIGTASLSPQLRAMEVIGKSLPPSAWKRWDDNSTTHRIELAVAELEAMYHETSEEPVSASSPDLFEKIKALEQASLELYTEAAHQLQNDKHILLLPCYRLHLDSCLLVQRDPALRRADGIKLLGRTVVTAQRLLALQQQVHGGDHFDVARTNLDLAQAIEELLSRSPQQLLSLPQQQSDQNDSGSGGALNSVSAWASLASRVRKDYNRIKALYPRDAESYVTTSAS